MSVFVTVRVKAEGKRLEELYAKEPTTFSNVAETAKPLGVISHRFYATDGEVMVFDEWQDEASFRKFFDAQPDIPKIMAEVGVSEPPAITVWRKLDLGDDIG